MRKNNINLRILFFMLLSIVMIKTNAQTGLNFQGVARTSNNVILASQAITIKLSILQGSATGTADYTETRRVTTNAQGLFTAVIGDTGAISTLGNFTTINWKNSPKFLKIEMDAAAGTNFITMGTTQFQYVAYAQFAKSVDAENIVGIVPVTLGGTGVNSLTGLKTALTLNNVNNTSDLSKPISTLTQTALDLKLNAADTSKYTKQTYTDSALLTKLSITENAASATTATTAGIASTATKLATARNINGVAFDGSGDITVIVDAGTLTGTSLKSTISSSSLTSVGTITSGIWSGTTITTNKGGTGLTETGTSGQLLTSTGTGTLTWTTPLSTSNFVPYSGATGIVNLGSYDLTVNSLTVGKGSGNQTHNTANGVQSLLRNTTGQGNTAIGYNTLFRNTTGLVNTATGAFALYINTTGQANTAAGVSALSSNTVGSYNTADGYFSLYSNTVGLSNTAVGQRSLFNNLTGSSNTAIGDGALNLNAYGNHNTAIGYGANVNVNNLENATAIGDGAIVSTSNTMQLGNTNVTNVNTSGTITAGGVTYPNIDGTSGQILTSTGAGTLTWTTPVFLPTIVIGTQQWMRENLDVMTYRNGDIIPQVTDPSAWAALTTGAWCWYNNDPLNGANYGKLYNWYAVNDPRGLAPQGWHIPTYSEWATLSTLLGGDAAAGGKMKTIGITIWSTPNTSATNESGFSGLPGGTRSNYGTFYDLGSDGYWWSATEEFYTTNAWYRGLYYNYSVLGMVSLSKKIGFSVRCLRD